MENRARIAGVACAAVCAALVLSLATFAATEAAGQAGVAAVPAPKPKREDPVEAVRRKINANTVSIVSGNITGTYLRYAADIASVLDDGDNLRVLPILSAGAVQNVTDIMFLRGVDMGLVRTDSVEAIRRAGKYGDIKTKVQYIARLVDDEMHVIAPREITDIRQLAGKRVNFDVLGSGTHFSSELIFERLGIEVQTTAYEQSVAYEKLRAGEIDASIFFGGNPVVGIANFKNADNKYHLVPVRFDEKLADYYLPATLSAKDYPNLLGGGETIDTIAAPTLLAVYNLRPGNERYQRVAHFVEAFFSKFDEFLKPPRHPKWREVNLAATVPGWTRFKPAQDWLDRMGPQAAQEAVSSATPDVASADELARFRSFLRQKNGGAQLSADQIVRLFEEFQRTNGGR
jgi:TRAP transporter TAXI family solute receptor